MQSSQIPQQAIEDCLPYLMETYGRHDEGYAAAAKANECSITDVEDVMSNRFENVVERYGVDAMALWEAATSFILQK